LFAYFEHYFVSPGAEGIVKADLIGTLVMKLKSELEEIKVRNLYG
jgi:hypothetical protein